METNSKIKSWSFFDFCMLMGKPKVAPCINKESGESFTAPAFEHPTEKVTVDGKQVPKVCWVHWAKKLGPLTAAEIGQRYTRLQVIELPVSAEVAAKRKAAKKQVETYVLCELGASSWEPVSIPGLPY